MYIQSPSPNFGSRRGYKPEFIVIHCTDGYFPSDMEYLQNPTPNSIVGPVSAHFVIAPNGDIHQLVDTDLEAWHAGRVDHPTAKLKMVNGAYVNPNYYSIGIETSMPSTSQISAPQHASLMELVEQMGAKYGIPLNRQHVIGHREIYSLKTCPGTIDIDSLLPVSEAQMVNTVAQINQEVNNLPASQQPAFRSALSTLLASIISFFSVK